MNWTAVVPLKRARDRKTRLAGHLSSDERAALSERMADHVLSVLAAAGVPTVLLSPRPRDGIAWWPDAGSGLNAELDRLRRQRGEAPLLVLPADLPLLAVDDVCALLAAADHAGVAIAPDRRGTGTNALALADARPFAFAFGTGSLATHLRQAGAGTPLCRRPGLALDIDTPNDLAEALRRGF